jgi:hypothetical protein
MILTFTRINQNFDVKVLVDKLTAVGERQTITTKEGTFFYRKYIDGDGNTFYTFGLHGIDQYWSSNSSTINELFGLDITECSIKESKGKCPDTYVAGYGIAKKDIQLPDCLEWRLHWGSPSIMLKEGIEFPRGNDYFMSTVLDSQGKLLHPKPELPKYGPRQKMQDIEKQLR